MNSYSYGRHFQDFLLKNRKELKLSQRAVSERSGVKRTTLAMLETSDNPNPSVNSVEKILRGLNKGFSDFDNYVIQENSYKELK